VRLFRERRWLPDAQPEGPGAAGFPIFQASTMKGWLLRYPRRAGQAALHLCAAPPPPCPGKSGHPLSKTIRAVLPKLPGDAVLRLIRAAILPALRAQPIWRATADRNTDDFAPTNLISEAAVLRIRMFALPTQTAEALPWPLTIS